MKLKIKEFMGKRLESFYKRPVLQTLLFSLAITVLFMLILTIASEGTEFLRTFGQNLLLTGMLSLFIVYPAILTLANLVFLIASGHNATAAGAGKRLELTTMILGTVFTVLYQWIAVGDVTFSEWQEQILIGQMHTPIAREGLSVVVLLSAAGLLGYLFLRFKPFRKQPPVITVLGISAMYLGVSQCLIFIVQIFRPDWDSYFLGLFPLNCILIAAKTVKELVIQWKKEGKGQEENSKISRRPLLGKFQRLLDNSFHWPWIAFLMAFPLLGILLGILTLFGQTPDSIINAWTETADWNLSQRIAPQGLYSDGHYLCTVAAGGHPGLVKPVRLGKRHGHMVIVNRQLCIANAFEQVLEEKLPAIHRIIRHLYDKYGYPLARHIRSPLAADLVYCLMKPAEWVFLGVIYLCDAKPENRIALQYLPLPADWNKDSLQK